MSNDISERWDSLVASVLFAAITLFILEDIARDLIEREPVDHLFIEGLNLATALVGFAFALWRMSRLNQALDAARRDASQLQQEKETLVQGVGSAIVAQFAGWGLSDAEAEIGLLLLKGLSLQDIADMRQTSERTVREQARAIYRKSGLAGRNELAAYFLEDLLPPSHQAA